MKKFGKLLSVLISVSFLFTACSEKITIPFEPSTSELTSATSEIVSETEKTSAQTTSHEYETADIEETEKTSDLTSETEPETASTVSSDTQMETSQTAAQTTAEQTVSATTAASTTSSAQTEQPAQSSSGATPYEIHGALSVKGADLVDSAGNKFQLYGMSTHGIAWYPDYINYDAFKTLRDDWKTNCVRIAMYTDEYGGYCSGGDQNNLKTLVKNGIKYATDLGMYIIVDWHVLNDQNPLKYQSEAIAFFDEISKQYKNQSNIIYEICNEPNSSASWSDIKSYANAVIPVIRKNDPDAIILVGTPTWSQDIDQAANSPLDYDNIMYTLHFYAATHTDWLRQRMETCIKNGLPVFVSEFGLCDASGGGAIDYDQSQKWKALIEKYNVSFMAWSLANKNETCCVIKSDCSKLSDWSENELSDSGKWLRNWFRSK